MASKILSTLKKWELEKQCVVIKGAGTKAFCSGGDLLEVIKDGRKSFPIAIKRANSLYTVCNKINKYRIPVIALIDGIVMGLGITLSFPSRFRVATERTIFAMPETSIGIFPDGGASYYLPRLQGKLGYYLGLTGHRLKGVDVLAAGVATHYTDSKNLDNLEASLVNCKHNKDINNILNEVCITNVEEKFTLHSHLNQINCCFNASTVEEIFENLGKDGSDWAIETLKLLNEMSPTSLKVTQKLLTLGSGMDLTDCLKMEYKILVNNTELNVDVIEGVSAKLIKRDKPKWNPSSLENVSDDIVNRFFKEIRNGLQLDC